MKKLFVLIIYTSILGLSSFSQGNEKEIQTQINTFFRALELGDSVLMRSVLHSDILLTTTFTDPKKGEKVFFKEPLNEFLTAVGTPHSSKWHEAIANLEYKIDDNLAITWMDYSFFVDDKFSHCGVNVFELVKLDDRWLITHIIDTRRKNNCNEDFLPN